MAARTTLFSSLSLSLCMVLAACASRDDAAKDRGLSPASVGASSRQSSDREGAEERPSHEAGRELSVMETEGSEPVYEEFEDSVDIETGSVASSKSQVRSSSQSGVSAPYPPPDPAPRGEHTSSEQFLAGASALACGISSQILGIKVRFCFNGLHQRQARLERPHSKQHL